MDRVVLRQNHIDGASDLARLLEDEPLSAEGEETGLPLSELSEPDIASEEEAAVNAATAAVAKAEGKTGGGETAAEAEADDELKGLDPETKKALKSLEDELKQLEAKIMDMIETIRKEKLVVKRLEQHQGELENLRQRKQQIQHDMKEKVLKAQLKEQENNLGLVREMRDHLLRKHTELESDEKMISSRMSALKTQIAAMSKAHPSYGNAAGTSLTTDDLLKAMQQEQAVGHQIQKDSDKATQGNVGQFIRELETNMEQATKEEAAKQAEAQAAAAPVAPATPAAPEAPPAPATEAPKDTAAKAEEELKKLFL